MPSRCDVVPNLADFPVRADPEGHAHDSEKRLTEKRFHAPRAERFDHVEFCVCEKREIKLVFGFELRLSVNRIAAAADDCGVQFLEFLDGVAKLGRFIGSTRRIRLGIKI